MILLPYNPCALILRHSCDESGLKMQKTFSQVDPPPSRSTPHPYPISSLGQDPRSPDLARLTNFRPVGSCMKREHASKYWMYIYHRVLSLFSKLENRWRPRPSHRPPPILITGSSGGGAPADRREGRTAMRNLHIVLFFCEERSLALIVIP